MGFVDYLLIGLLVALVVGGYFLRKKHNKNSSCCGGCTGCSKVSDCDKL